jgi:aldose sugar dehydrogenase
MTRLALAVACLVAVACSQPSPSPPNAGSSPTQTITGAERIGWDQQAGSADELATFHYLIYVDDVGTELQNVSCATPASARFACSGQLPSMSAGPHAIALSAYIDSDGTRQESPRSETLSVVVVSRAVTAPVAAASVITTLDGVQLHASTIARGLDDPADLSFAPDGRIFIAERGGRVLVFRDGRLQPAPALTLSDATTADRQGLLAMAVDPRYGQNHFVYIVYTSASGFRLARFRGAGDTLGDRAILMEGVASRPARPAASLRFGPDGKLYAGFDDAGDALRAGDLGSFNGKILRLNADATTPADQAGGTPVYAANVNAPLGVDWDASGATLWVVEDAASGPGRVQAVVAGDSQQRRGTAVRRYSLPDGAGVAALAFYRSDLIPEFRGDLLLAADAEHAVLRLRFDARDPWKVVATERLLGDSLDGARTIGVGRDGAIYLCAAHTLIRLAPSRSAPGIRSPARESQ